MITDIGPGARSVRITCTKIYPHLDLNLARYESFVHGSSLIDVVWMGDLVSSSRGERGESDLGAASI
jgi:hypothetical protein